MEDLEALDPMTFQTLQQIRRQVLPLRSDDLLRLPIRDIRGQNATHEVLAPDGISRLPAA